MGTEDRGKQNQVEKRENIKSGHHRSKKWAKWEGAVEEAGEGGTFEGYELTTRTSVGPSGPCSAISSMFIRIILYGSNFSSA